MIKELFTFSGRATRKQFWLTQLGLTIYIIITLLVAEAILLLTLIPSYWIYFAVAAKRCRDFGQTPYYCLTMLIPIVGIVFFFIIGLKKTKVQEKELAEKETV